ncbi:MAG: ATP-binding cassette domain-containing protein [Gordonia sp. (in: high G+C Gram-positive bacteria)]
MTDPSVVEPDYWLDSEQLRAEHLSVSYGGAPVLDDISVTLRAGEIVGLVGESGAGKSTLARVLLGRITQYQGQITYGAGVLTPARSVAEKRLIQMIYQDPWSSLNPMRTVRGVLEELIALRRKQIRRCTDQPEANTASRLYDTAEGLCELVSISADLIGRRPGQLSGGQRQRFAIARALAVRPRFLLADEPTSALDAAVRAQLGRLFVDLAREQGIGVLLITHDLLSVAEVADRIIVLRNGRVVECGEAAQVLATPTAQYTRELIEAVPILKYR